MLTPEGTERILAVLAGRADDSLVGGSLVVSDGERTASAPLDEQPVVEITERGAVLHVAATFGEDAGNFEWRVRELRSAQGVVLDRVEEDQGRKAPGAVWTLEHDVELLAGDQ